MTRVYSGIQALTEVHIGLYRYTRVYRGIQALTEVHIGLYGYTRVYRGIQGFIRLFLKGVYIGIKGCKGI